MIFQLSYPVNDLYPILLNNSIDDYNVWQCLYLVKETHKITHFSYPRSVEEFFWHRYLVLPLIFIIDQDLSMYMLLELLYYI